MVSLPRSLRVLTYFIVMLIINAGLLQAQTKRRAVIEEYTGAWCQYCPSGAVAFDQLSNNYTEEEVIMCAVHNGDGMALSNDADFAQFRNGFPSGAINRAQFGVSPGAWAGAVAGIIAQDASVDVNLKNIVFNSSTRRVTFDLEARFLKDVTGEVRVNVMVIEDSVVGTGSAYDQVNAFNTTSGHPFFGKGSPVKNYPHRHVVRLFQDGSWGASGAVPNNPKAGAIYKKSYSISMNASWVPSRISLVGTVNKYNTDIAQREILNAVQESLTVRSTRATLAGVDAPYLTIAAGAKQTYKVNVTNENKVNLDFTFAVNETKSTIPSDWTATVEPASLNLDPGASGEITITVEAPKSFTQAELASITIEALPSEATNTKPKMSYASVYVLSNNAKTALVYGYNVNQFNDYYKDALQYNEIVGSGIVSLPNNADLLSAYKDQMKVYIFSVFGGALLSGQIYQGSSIGGKTESEPLAKSVSTLLAAGKRVYLSAPQSLWWAFDKSTNSAAGKNPDVISFFNTLKLEHTKLEQRYILSGNTVSLKTYPVKGFDNDSIGDQFNAMANNQNFAYVTFYNDIFKIGAGSACKPVLYSDNVNSNIVGVRYTSPEGGKLVFVTSPIESYDNQVTRQNFIDRSITWLASDVFEKVKKPVLTLNPDVKFGTVELKQTKNMTTDITNSGDTALVITSMQISGSKKAAFKIIDAPTLPLTIAAGQKATISLAFTPDSKISYIASLDFTSNTNGQDNSTSGIDLVGEGIETIPDPPVFTGITELNYGVITANTDKTLSLTNATADAVTVTVVEITGPDKDAFKATVNLPYIVPKGQKFQAKISFNPTRLGVHSATMNVTSTLPNNKTNVYTVALSGTKEEVSGVKEDLALTSSVQISPNPTSENAHVSFNLLERNTISLSVTDINGTVLYTVSNQTLDAGIHAIMIPVQSIVSGSYTVTLRTQSGAIINTPFTVVR